MKIAVTGASGFVGMHVVCELASRRNVSIVAGSRSGAAPSSASPCAEAAKVAWAAMDVEGGEAPADTFERLGRPDVLIHLAWAGLPNYKSLHHLEAHLAHQYRFLSGLVRAGLRSLVCTGTCFEYGMQSGPLSEDMKTEPGNPYGFAKDTLQRQLRFFRAQHPFNFTWARLFYMYGDGQPASSLYSQFSAACARGDREFRMSGGEQLRDFLPVSEVARLLVALALKAPDSGIVNICSGRPVSVRALVEGWRRARGSDIELALGHYPYPDYEPMAFWGSDTRLRQVLREAR
jgi:dTDP-6-deoxy-L-talose 4-dehydrogenase (NAD+)